MKKKQAIEEIAELGIMASKCKLHVEVDEEEIEWSSEDVVNAISITLAWCHMLLTDALPDGMRTTNDAMSSIVKNIVDERRDRIEESKNGHCE